jgi:N-acetylmuramoyl-L-alanine amidase
MTLAGAGDGDRRSGVAAELRRGRRGEAVRDVQTRLTALGYDVAPDDPGTLGAGTESALRVFQEARGLRADGVVGASTWAALVESGFSLGDRLLYFRFPMLRGDDIVELQRRLNGLGFDAGREDGILGHETSDALVEFQRASGLGPDGICGRTTIDALDRVDSFAGGSAAPVRERERMRVAPRRLAGRRVYLAADPGLAVVGEQIARLLGEAGSVAVLETAGDDDTLVAAEANRFGADLFLELRTGTSSGWSCAYFASGEFRSEAGLAAANAIHDAVRAVIGGGAGIHGRAYPALRETRMAAVVCELVAEGDVDGMREVVAKAGAVARAIVAGIQRGIEDPEIDG